MKEDEEKVNSGNELSPEPDPIYIPGEYKLNSFNWLSAQPADSLDNKIVEVRFKNTRKGFYRNVNDLRLEIGDLVAVEASPGHDIGRISMIGRLVDIQFRQQKNIPPLEELKKVYRKAKSADIEKWEEAKSLEVGTMLKSRIIAEDLGLKMKIGDVEYQGDKTKAIFYYIADERVDFRQLIKVLAEQFRVRIEMRQIGARQEAGRIGGIGSCGRELCCSSHITNFVSVSTTHAKIQELSLNPQKLAGQCSKLKCCLNYELNCYLDKQKQFPSKEIPLELKDETLYFFKMEVFKETYWYSSERDTAMNIRSAHINRVAEIQALNKKGIKPDKLVEAEYEEVFEKDFNNAAGSDSLTRFEHKKKERRGKYRGKKRNRRNERNRRDK